MRKGQWAQASPCALRTAVTGTTTTANTKPSVSKPTSRRCMSLCVAHTGSRHCAAPRRRQGGALRERRHGRMRDHAVAAACSGGQEHICLHVFCDFLCPTGVLCCCLLPRAPHSGYGDTACPPRQVRRKNGVPALQPGTLSSLCTTLHRHASLLKSKLSNANSTR